METEAFQLGKIKMYVSEDHRFGTDAFLLAHYANVHKNDVVCDLCTGCGIIPLIFCKGIPPKLIYAVDIQSEAISLLRKTADENGLQSVIKPIECDLRNIPQSVLTYGTVDVVTVNPPYMPSNSGLEKVSRAQAIARHELMCNIEDVCAAAGRLLKYGGLLKMCHRPERLGDVICAMRSSKIEPKAVTFVCNGVNEKPWLFLISGKKGANHGMTVEKPLILMENGVYTEEYEKLYE
ncbi:MAG: methyltransferase [Lachnospiraceae bacterium]|nr:methyltransferase [Ruminococcus sp.]MCM1275995.1 methyltransferase [Lachnospiraceae bacterium]